MDSHLVRQWAEGHKAVNRLVEAERREATSTQKIRQMTAIWQRAHVLGFIRPKPFDAALAERWQRLRSVGAEPRA